MAYGMSVVAVTPLDKRRTGSTRSTCSTRSFQPTHIDHLAAPIHGDDPPKVRAVLRVMRHQQLGDPRPQAVRHVGGERPDRSPLDVWTAAGLKWVLED
jgi:hypothetical protein